MAYYGARTGHPVSIETTGADQVVLGPDPARRCVWFPCLPVDVRVQFGLPTTAQAYFRAGGNVTPFRITYEEIGDLICQELHLEAATGNIFTLLIGQA